MNILIINTTDRSGGAAIAAARLKNALINLGEKPRMLVARKEGDDIATFDVRRPLSYKAGWLCERLGIFLRQGLSKSHLWDIDPATAGVDITALPEFKEADVIHLHWVNQGFLSLKGLRKILSSSKPVVWTMHDAWPFTGLCHSPLDCRNFQQQCGRCMLLRRQGERDWSRKVWEQKAKIYNNVGRVAFVACSKWLADMARSSSLLSGHTVLDIPNPIDTYLFTPRDKEEARRQLGLPADKKLILFSAYNVNAPIKGLNYLHEALRLLAEKDSAKANEIAIVYAGRGTEQQNIQCPVSTAQYPLGYVTDPKQMAVIYNAVDLFCIPSLQENLPNTIMEAKASGVPTVGFDVGGIPQMIDHLHDGYLAKAKDAADLAKGIEWALFEADSVDLAQRNRFAAVEQYSEARVAKKYLKLYKELGVNG